MSGTEIREFLRSCRSKVKALAHPQILQIYRYRVEVTDTHSIAGKLRLLAQSFRKTFVDRRTILFYPEGPMPFHALYKVLMFLGYRVTSNTQKNYDVAIKWWLAFDGNPFAPEKPLPSTESAGRNGAKWLNIRCNDISKVRVNSVFEEVFGYPVSVDPRTYQGKCVMKLNWNALHKGQVIECPAEPQEGDVVYQKLVRNEVAEGLVEDMRVPVFGNKTPFVYLKYRSVSDRLIDRVHTNRKATIAEVPEVLSESELSDIYRFCERIGLDYGELDVLRDRVDGRIYIVDANNTPSGPPSPISDDEAKVAVMRLSKGFEEAFGVRKS